MNKIRWIFELAVKEGCEIILQPGDFFDSPDQANYVIRELVSVLRYYDGLQIFSIYGQHDTRYRKTFNTTLGIFEEMGLVSILGNNSYNCDGIDFYGASLGKEIPDPVNRNEINILIAHKMIVQSQPLWADQTDYISTKDMLKKYQDYNLIVSGDNHQSFIHGSKFGSMLINCGSLMRTTIAQRDHHPVAYIVDSETNEITKYEIPIRPIEEVMNLELADEIKERNKDLEAFMSGLSSNYDAELSFEKNLTNLMKMNETSKEIRGIAEEIMGRYYAGN
jgi:DNA repair exonuclease SbcCD nuclease subunit